MTSVEVPDLTDIREGLSLRRQARIVAGERARRHAASACLLVSLLVLVGAVHAIGMWTFPRWVDDPGTYLSQAWSFQYQHALSPYSYIYDHAPAGWIQLSLWSMLTNGFNRHASAIGFGNECMLIAKLASCALLFALGRRLQFSRWGAAAAVLLFGLCPLELVYSRWTFLDNLVTPWLLLAFLLAASPRRSISAATGAALAFAMAALTKETALVVLPALVWAMAQNLDRRNRPQLVAVAGFGGLLLMAMYPLYALYKGELLEHAGRNSLLGTAKWQLMERESSGSLLDPSSPTTHMVGQWLGIDRWLLLAGLTAIPIALLARRLRPAVLVLVIQWLVLVRGGYVPFMHVVNLMPWSALLVVGAVEIVAGNRHLATFRRLAGGRRSGRPLPRRRVVATGLAAVCLAAALVGSWTPTLRQMTLQARQEPPLWSATQWLADNVPRSKVLVVHDSIWTDLVHHYGFDPQPIIVYKLDTDPAVRERLRRIDYLVLPNWYYATPTGVAKYPTATEARKHAVAVAWFGSGDDGVRIYRVSRYWRPG
jgi:Dolichyl-phosphate-mannose-protein mannosyltransferase